MAVQTAVVLHFEKGWQESLSAPIQRGQPLGILFDPERLAYCRLTMRGAEFWEILGHIRCHPGGQLYEHSMLEPIRPTPNGPVVALQPAPFELYVPVDTTALELWFENTDTYYRAERGTATSAETTCSMSREPDHSHERTSATDSARFPICPW